jgi:hypothetical protein
MSAGMKPIIRIKWVHEGDPATLQLAQQIRTMFEQMPGVIDAVRQPRRMVRRRPQSQTAVASVECASQAASQADGPARGRTKCGSVLSHLRGELPNWHAGGSIN